jgi:hypothetical protein
MAVVSSLYVHVSFRMMMSLLDFGEYIYTCIRIWYVMACT